MCHEHLPAELMERTPVYIFDIPVLKKRAAYLRSRLPGHVRLCYAVKANPFLVRELLDCVDCFEICSPGELTVCEQAGLPREMFVLSGVYKDPELFASRIASGDRDSVYTAESLSQLEMLQRAAKAAQADLAAHADLAGEDAARKSCPDRKQAATAAGGRKLRVLLRLTSGNQFGMSREEIEDVVARREEYDALTLTGIQFFSGTQKTSFKKLKRELESVDLFLKTLYDTYSFQSEELEFGPGLAVSYFEGDPYEEEPFLALLKEALESLEFKGRITLEMGRVIAASCGSYLTKVVDLKSNQAGNFAIVDGGMHQLVYYGQFMAMKHPHMRVFPPRNAGSEQEWTICGSLCTINDLLVKKLPIMDLKAGDILIFENTGAYCMTEGISLFLTRDLPEVVLLGEDGALRTVRGRFETSQLNCPDYGAGC